MQFTTAATTTPPTLRYINGSIVAPGDRIGTIRQVCSGKGTYIRSNGHIYVSLAGRLQIEYNNINNRKTEGTTEGGKEGEEASVGNEPTTAQQSMPLFTCSVIPTNHRQRLPAISQVLHIGQIVVGVVTRITTQMAIVDIRVAQHVGKLPTSCEGAIRLEDVRSSVTEQIQPVGDCFRPNDLVACRILSLGDSRRYFLSTAETELGVLRAKTTKGIAMIPISWKEMECPETGIREPRKCAKPIAMQLR